METNYLVPIVSRDTPVSGEIRSITSTQYAERINLRPAVRGLRRMTPGRIAVLLGYGYGDATPLDVYNEIVLGTKTPRTEAMSSGLKLEPVILADYAESTGRTLYSFDAAPSGDRLLLVHPRYDFIGGLPDVLAFDKDGDDYSNGIVVDAKNVNDRVAANDFTDDTISPRYYIQIQLYAEMLGVRRSQLTYLVGGYSFRRSPEYERDDYLVDKAIATAVDFWNTHVVTLSPPKPSNRRDVVSLYPRSTEQVVEAEPDIIGDVASALALKREIKSAEELLNAVETRIVLAFGERDSMVDSTSGELLATFKSAKDSTSTDWKSVVEELRRILVEEFPLGASSDRWIREILDKLSDRFTASKPGSRRLLIKNPKGRI